MIFRAVVLTIVFFLSFCSHRPSGDVDGNGVVSLSDAVYLENYLSRGGPAPDSEKEADVDCNGHIDLFDVKALLEELIDG